jgi:hypothetical protein
MGLMKLIGRSTKQASTDADLENAKQILEADWLITNL